MRKVRGKRSGPPPERKQISLRLKDDLLEFLDRESLRLTGRPPFMEVTVSDVVRLAIMHYRDTMASKPFQPRLCDIASQGDERLCVRCGRRWTAADGEPECAYAGSEQQ